MMVEPFENVLEKFVKTSLEAHFKSNPLEPHETWVTKCGENFGRAMQQNFPKNEEDATKLPHWDTYIICTLLKEHLQTVS
jgi:hypothetical protein